MSSVMINCHACPGRHKFFVVSSDPNPVCPKCGHVVRRRNVVREGPATAVDAAWLAGCLEGRATFSLQRSSNGLSYPSIALYVPRDAIGVLLRVHKVIGAENIAIYQHGQSGGRRGGIATRISGATWIRHVQQIVLPFGSDYLRAKFAHLWQGTLEGSHSSNDGEVA